jgi:hypothetical protein
MGHNQRIFRRYLCWALLAVVASAAILLLFGVLASKASSFVPAGEPYWAVMQGVCAVAATSALMGSAVFALMQYSNSRHQRHLGIYNDIFGRLMQTEQVEARRWIYEKFQFGGALNTQSVEAMVQQLDDHGRAQIKLCLNSLDHLGFLVSQGWLDDDKTLGWLNPIVLKTWECLKPLVDYERRRRDDRDYYVHIDSLASRCAAVDKHGVRVDNTKPLEQRAPTAWHQQAI